MLNIKENLAMISELEDDKLVLSAKDVVQKERECTIALILHLMAIDARKIYVLAGFSSLAEYCMEVLGLSQNKAWKRSQVARVSALHPDLLLMLEKGEISVSHIALCAPRLTEANKDVLLNGIKGKSLREAGLFCSSVTYDGTIIEGERKSTLRFEAGDSFLQKLDRAREVMQSRTNGGGLANLLEEAVDLLLEKHDPLRKAERALQREKREAKSNDVTHPSQKSIVGKSSNMGGMEYDREIEEEESSTSSRKSDGIRGSMKGESSSRGIQKGQSRYIPAKIRHAVILRDGGRCTYVSPDGRRCSCRGDVELDHKKMWCHGGEHSIDNLRVRCRTHNFWSATKELGGEFMQQKITSPPSLH